MLLTGFPSRAVSNLPSYDIAHVQLHEEPFEHLRGLVTI